MEYKPYDKCLAKFTPRNVGDLKPRAVPFIGKVLSWQCLWEIEEGEYKGQMCWWNNYNGTKDEDTAYFGWVPTEDLEIYEYHSRGW